MNKQYTVIEQHGPNDISAWIIELPEDFFNDYTNDGYSTRGPVDTVLKEVIEICGLSENTDEELLAKFHEHYESCWDYLHQAFNRGFCLIDFIRDRRPDRAELLWQPKPVHISDVPEDIRVEYLQFLAEQLAKHWGTELADLADLPYTDLDAAREAVEYVQDAE